MKSKYLCFNKINKISNIYLIFILILFKLNKTEITEYPKDIFNSEKIIINNLIDKIKSINNIIIFGDLSYRYINFASYSNGDMVIETTCFPPSSKRMFYGLKENGRPFFINKTNNEETQYYSKDINHEDYKKLEAQGLIIKLSDIENNGKEYYLSVSKLECNAEMFDFENDEVYHKTVSSFTTIYNVKSLRHAFFPLSSSSSQYYYIFGFISYIFFENKIFLQKHIFNSISDFESTNTKTYEGTSDGNAYGSQISCYQTAKGLLNCFYLTINDNVIFYNIVKYENDFTDKINSTFESNILDEDSFMKCIHLKEEVGVFAYYYNYSDHFYPVLLFREFDKNVNQFIYYLPDEFEFSSITLLKYEFLNNILLNDLIKLSENKIAFTATVENKELIYIILINIFREKKIKIRYYALKLYLFYNYKILLDLRTHKYNNF